MIACRVGEYHAVGIVRVRGFSCSEWAETELSHIPVPVHSSNDIPENDAPVLCLTAFVAKLSGIVLIVDHTCQLRSSRYPEMGATVARQGG